MPNWLMTCKMGNLFRPLFLILLLFPGKLFSQPVSVQTTVDKKDILIGEQLKLKLRILFPLSFDAANYSLIIPDSIPHFELIDKGSAVPVNFKDNSTAMEQVITLTGFDSGKWTIPAFVVNTRSGNAATANLFTDSISVNIGYSPSDGTNRLRDIKPVIDVKIPDYLWYYIAAGLLLVFLAGFLMVRYFKRRKQIPSPAFSTRLSPLEEAIQELEKLKRSELLEPPQIKLYHTRLSEIFRRYLGRKQNMDLSTKTTGDLLINLSANNFSMETVSSLALVLRSNDAVKFAKYLPPPPESEDCILKLMESIHLIEQQTTNHKL